MWRFDMGCGPYKKEEKSSGLIPLLEQKKKVNVRDSIGKGTTDVLLVWHIATSIFQVRCPTASSSSDSDGNSNKVVATHLSGYCAYLVAYCPELLPDDD
ncbi:hypothetical protein E2562_007347 [Oryza meyeriana var. granulata]|uniref:Uncharacterized protein n=1 Tax=Oryza meyeriana var. granulata TaxID=110450 RepID=A0A6G1CZL5_9ORYZ|nr:hypothetical protein E2562_007347 [Oryza meyeriana var. granulata]